MSSMQNQIKKALTSFIFKRPYRIPSEVLDTVHKDRWALLERFALRPGINADRDVPAGNTYNTTQMQLGIDKNPNFEVLGTNATSATVAHSTNGGLTLTTTTGSGDQVIIAPHLNSNVSAWTVAQWNSAKSPTFECVIQTGASVAAQTIWAGFKLTNTSVVATDDDQVFFRFQDTVNSGGFQIITSRAGTDTTQSIPASQFPALVASTRYRLQIALSAARQPRFWINDQEILYVDANSVTQRAFPALTDNINFIPYVGIQTGTTAAKAMDLRGIACSRL